MLAIVNDAYGPPDGLALREVPTPRPAADEVLVRVRAASVNAYDWHVMRGLPYLVRVQEGLRRPKSNAMGVDVAGQVEAVGARVTRFQPGDEVFGARSGAFAEYVCGAERRFTPKPANLTFEQAAAVPTAGTTALQALRDKGQLRPGQRVLINGAAGGVGTFAVQLANAFGAEVTAVCGPRHVDTVRSLGADRVIDYTAEDFARDGQRYDLILNIAGNRSLLEYRRILRQRGTLVLVGAPRGQWIGPLATPLKALALSRVVNQNLRPLLATHSDADRLTLKEFIEADKVTPVIDRAYPLRETAEAIRYLEVGHARGKIVIAV